MIEHGSVYLSGWRGLRAPNVGQTAILSSAMGGSLVQECGKWHACCSVRGVPGLLACQEVNHHTHVDTFMFAV